MEEAEVEEEAGEAEEEHGVCQHTTCKACRLLVWPHVPHMPGASEQELPKKFFKCISVHYKEDDIMLVRRTLFNCWP